MIYKWLILAVAFASEVPSRAFGEEADPTSRSATVIGINSSNHTVKLDQGTAAGFTQNTAVCFYNEAKKKVGCAKIVKSTAEFSLIKIKSDVFFNKIKKGNQAKLKEGGASSTGEVTVAEGGPNHRNNLTMIYIYTPLTLTKFNRLSYNAPGSETANDLDSLWINEGTTTSSLFAAVMAGEIAVGKSMSFSLGLRYRMFGNYDAKANYNTQPALSANYTSIEQKSSAFGAYVDFTFLDLALSSSVSWQLSTGLDVDMPSLQFKTMKKNDVTGTESEIASYKSSMTIIGTRLGTRFLFMIGPFGLIVPGINVVIPVAVVGAKESATVTDSQASMLKGGATSAEKDLIESIGHTKNSVGVEVVLGGLLAF